MNAQRLQRGHSRPRARGFILLTVVLALTLVAAVAFLLNRSGGMNMSLAARGLQADAARYVAEAGLAQINAQTQGRNCSGYTDLATATAFGAHSFAATVEPKSGSPVTLTATATTADGASATLTRNNVTMYQSTPATLTLQPDAAGGVDGWLNGASAKVDINNGANPRLTLNASSTSKARPLIKFDLSAIPAGSEITAATLSLYQETTGSVGSSPPNPVYNLHRVTRAWVEGTKMGTQTADGATWNSTDGSAAWTTPGGDFDPAVAATAPAAATLEWRTWDVGALVANWVNGAYPNHGMLVDGVGTISTLGFASSDNGTAANRPKLEVSFLPACGPPAPPGPPPPPPAGVTLAASQDTWIDSSGSGAANYGGSQSFTVTNGGKAGRALVRFDLGTVPAGTLLTSATLKLWVGSFSPKVDSILTVYKVWDPWVEGTRDGSGSADGATWKTRDGSNAWSAGFGIVTGFDLGVPSSATTLPSSFSSGWVEWNVTPLAQRWVDGVSPNYGAAVMIDTASEVIFNSREWTIYQPQLVLTY